MKTDADVRQWLVQWLTNACGNNRGQHWGERVRMYESERGRYLSNYTGSRREGAITADYNI